MVRVLPMNGPLPGAHHVGRATYAACLRIPAGVPPSPHAEQGPDKDCGVVMPCNSGHTKLLSSPPRRIPRTLWSGRPNHASADKGEFQGIRSLASPSPGGHNVSL